MGLIHPKEEERYYMVEGDRARVDLDTFEMWHRVHIHRYEKPRKQRAQISADNYERKHTIIRPLPVSSAVGALFGCYYPIMVIEQIVGEKRVLAERALIAR